MWDTLEVLRNKPKPIRDNYAFFGAVIITGMLGVMWGFSQIIQLEQVTVSQEDESSPVESSSAFAKFFEESKTNLASSFHSFKESTSGGEDSILSTEAIPAESLATSSTSTLSASILYTETSTTSASSTQSSVQ